MARGMYKAPLNLGRMVHIVLFPLALGPAILGRIISEPCTLKNRDAKRVLWHIEHTKKHLIEPL
jgi:hypothetical protein